ncbi:uncharacterized protein LOC123523133 [Mercenaria mercenaria]|uniref:uncharacterized protein LOC123523133 n=1 Tax=Mercenaria mercenaria TaxID=6596 RepID=UPI00234E7F4B|nr:uncharacterized protein LOC123523133 [Mercenaria mercenaria]
MFLFKKLHRTYCQPYLEIPERILKFSVNPVTDDLRLPAVGYCVDCEEHLCDSCFNNHRRPKPLQHHKLLDKGHTPLMQRQVIDSTEFNDTIKEAGKITEECQKISADVKQVVEKSNASLTDVLTVITKFRQEINQRLDELEMDAKDAATTLQQDNDTRLRTTKTSCDNTIQTLKATSDTIKHLNTSKKADRLFIELKNAEQLIQDNENRKSQLTTAEYIKEYMFEPSPAIAAIETLLKNQKSLGTLTAKLQQSSLPPTAALKFGKTSPRNINVKTSSDKCCCYITGMTTTYSNQILLADNNNNSIKMVDTNSQSIQQLRLGSKPFDVTTITRNELAVTMPDIKTIQFLFYSSNILSEKNSMKVDEKCYGISNYEGKLAVTFQDPAQLKIMDLKGTVLVNVTKKSSGVNIFRYPQCVTTNCHSIYVSDPGMRKVIWLNWRGELLGSYENMGFPRGLAMLTDGSLFVTDQIDNNILNITGDCRESTIALKDLNKPWALCWFNASKTLYSSNISVEDERNYIQVYKMI